jgi:hypothetical protein
LANPYLSRGVIAVLVLGMGIACDERRSSFNPLASNPSAPTFVAAFRVEAISPTTGLVGDSLLVAGSGFTQGATVTLDGIAAAVSLVTGAGLRATAPSHAVGVVDVVVTNPDGQTATLARAFTYDVVSLVASPTAAAAGTPLTVSWTAPKGRSAADWIALFKVGIPNSNYDDDRWQYTRGAITGTYTVNAPSAPGDYEFRYLLNDDDTDVARSRPITVR